MPTSEGHWGVGCMVCFLANPGSKFNYIFNLNFQLEMRSKLRAINLGWGQIRQPN